MVTAASLLCVALSPCQEPAGQPKPLDPSIKRTLVPLAVPMAVYEPIAPGAKSHIGVFVQHPGVDYIEHSACTELAKRGYTVLCSAPANAELLDEKLLQAKSGVAYLRQYPGIRKSDSLRTQRRRHALDGLSTRCGERTSSVPGPRKTHQVC